jgi:hypothetical protein
MYHQFIESGLIVKPEPTSDWVINRIVHVNARLYVSLLLWVSIKFCGHALDRALGFSAFARVVTSIVFYTKYGLSRVIQTLCPPSRGLVIYLPLKKIVYFAYVVPAAFWRPLCLFLVPSHDGQPLFFLGCSFRLKRFSFCFSGWASISFGVFVSFETF